MSSICVASSTPGPVAIIKGCFPAVEDVDLASDLPTLKILLQRKVYEHIFLDIDLLRGKNDSGADKSHLREHQTLQQLCPSAYIFIMADNARIRQAVEIVKAGASNYLTYPLIPDEVKYVVESVRDYARMELELSYLRNRVGHTDFTVNAQTRSPLMRAVYEKVGIAAPTNALILLTGETGTGKSVIARLIHNRSTRSANQFISLHCGAIPDTLIESELFGHEKGAFTGAVRRKLGKFELAHKGTLFLDEIATITPAAQIKLLQVLQEKTFQRVGGETSLDTDARIVASSNMELKKMVDNGQFRSDLYYRLNVFPIELPSLRERKEDIPLLIEFFIQQLKKKYPKDIHAAHPAVIEAFERYDWPGNVRELENLIERGYILETSQMLTPESFPSEFFAKNAPAACLPLDTSISLAEFREMAKESAERQYLMEVLTQNKGRINKSADQAGISTRQINKLLTKYKIRKEEFKL